MKLIHTADLHLDAPLSGVLPPELARSRSAELCEGFVRLCRLAEERQADAVLICGDLFDSQRVNPDTADRVLAAIGEAEEVEFFCLLGNHDGGTCAFDGRELPENLHLFGEGWKSYRFGDVVITGREPVGEQWESMYAELNLREEDCNIVMLHGALASSPGEERICPTLLAGLNIDYLALGHFHSFRQGELGEDGLWCYSGCPEGRGFDECGDKGFVALDTAGKRIRTAFVPFARRRLHRVEAPVAHLEDFGEQLAAVWRLVEHIPGEDLVELVLQGEHGPDTRRDPERLREALSERFYHVRLKDESRLRLCIEDFDRDVSLRGAFVRQVLGNTSLDEEDRRRVLAMGLAALEGRSVTE